MASIAYDKVTFSIPHALKLKVDELKEQFNVSKSEILKNALEEYVLKEEEKKIKRAVEMMMDEYSTDRELTALTSLDSEPFK